MMTAGERTTFLRTWDDYDAVRADKITRVTVVELANPSVVLPLPVKGMARSAGLHGYDYGLLAFIDGAGVVFLDVAQDDPPADGTASAWLDIILDSDRQDREAA